jgi:hypothetical protein
VKTEDEVLTEWTLDEIQFDGGLEHKVFTRDQMNRIAEALRAHSPNEIVILKSTNPVVINASQRAGKTVAVRNLTFNPKGEMGYAAKSVINWQLGISFRLSYRTHHGNCGITGVCLARFHSMAEAAKLYEELTSEKSGSRLDGMGT